MTHPAQHHPDLRARLAHVLWVGGPPDCGKSTVADLLAERHGLQSYHMDAREPDHIRRSDPVLHPATHALRPHLDRPHDPALLDQTWVLRTPAQMAQSAAASWTDRLPLIIEDLLALPRDRPIIAEGPGFFPEAVLPFLSDPRQALWMAPSEGFKRSSHERREKGAWRVRLVSDPERAERNHIERDLLFAEMYRRECAKLDLPLIEVDGTRSADEIASEVESHFGPLLRRRERR